MSALISQTATAHLPACHISRLGADTILSMSLIERHRQFTPSGIICGLSAVRVYLLLPAFIHPVLVVANDSRLSNAPAAASSSIIRRLRRIENISVVAPQVLLAPFEIFRLQGTAWRRYHYLHVCQI